MAAEGEPLIRAMPVAVSRRISAGQVILDAANIVKELLENSLDAGATSVDIRLRDDGMTAIEVVDDGSGIDPANFDLLSAYIIISQLCFFCFLLWLFLSL